MLDPSGQQADPLGVAAADEVAESAGDEHAIEVRVRVRRAAEDAMPARIAPVASCNSRTSRCVSTIGRPSRSRSSSARRNAALSVVQDERSARSGGTPAEVNRASASGPEA